MGATLFAALEDEWGSGVPYSTSVPVLGVIVLVGFAFGAVRWVQLGRQLDRQGDTIPDRKDRVRRRMLATAGVGLAVTPALLVVASLVWCARAANEPGADVELGWSLAIVWAVVASLTTTGVAAAGLHANRLIWRGAPDAWVAVTLTDGVAALACLAAGLGRWPWLLLPAALYAALAVVAFGLRDEVSMRSQQVWVSVTPSDPLTRR